MLSEQFYLRTENRIGIGLDTPSSADFSQSS